MELSSLLNLFNGYVYLIESNTSSQHIITRIKLEPLNGSNELYFYGKVAPNWVKIAPKLGGLRIDGFSVVIIKTQEKTHLNVLQLHNQT